MTSTVQLLRQSKRIVIEQRTDSRKNAVAVAATVVSHEIVLIIGAYATVKSEER